MERVAWLERRLVPSLAAAGRLPRPADSAAAVRARPAGPAGPHFASALFEISVRLAHAGPDLELFVKLAPATQFFREFLHCGVQFRNETHVYNAVIPALVEVAASCSLRDLFPRCYAAEYLSDAETYLVMENLKCQGYAPYASTFMDYEYSVAALEVLGRFHAASYALKLRDPARFQSISAAFEETRYTDTAYRSSFSFMDATALRGLDNLLARGGDERVRELRDELAAGGVLELMQRLVRPKEPSALICHGDFNRNNLLFRRAPGPGGSQLEVKLIDFQLVRCGSPALDVGFFLLCSAEADTRRRRWRELLQRYHSSFSAALCAILGYVPAECSLEGFLRDFADHVMYGYVLCSFFIPMLMMPQEDIVRVESIFNGLKTPRAIETFLVDLGGKTASDLVGDMALEVIDMRSNLISLSLN